MGHLEGCNTDAPPLFPLFPLQDCSPSPVGFFWDTPWGSVPPGRQGHITVIPVLPRGRLLGGSSKLAALAAARKKKQEEQNRGPESSQPTDTKADTDKAIALLDKLTVKNKDSTKSSTDTEAIAEGERKPLKNRLQYRKRQPSPEPVAAEPEEETVEEPKPSIQLPNLRIGPSSFASTLCGDGNSATVRKSAKAQASENLTEVLPKVIDGDPFAGPSPDDIVLRAQAQGRRAVHG